MIGKFEGQLTHEIFQLLNDNGLIHKFCRIDEINFDSNEITFTINFEVDTNNDRATINN